MKSPFPATAWVWLIVVGVASFLTWAALGYSSGFPFGSFSVSVNAWSGNLTLLGIQLPNWLTVMAAVGAVGASYARWNGTQLSPSLPRWLLIYAIAHVVLFSFLVFGGRGTLGVGAILMFAALIGIWRTLAKVSISSPTPSMGANTEF